VNGKAKTIGKAKAKGKVKAKEKEHNLTWPNLTVTVKVEVNLKARKSIT